PNVGGLDGLAETDLVGDQHPADWGFDEAHHRLELMRIEVSVARLHRIEDVGEIALDFFEREHAPQVTRATEGTRGEQLEQVGFFAHQFEKIEAFVELLVWPEIHFHHEEAAS